MRRDCEWPARTSSAQYPPASKALPICGPSGASAQRNRGGGIYAATVTAAAEIPLPASQINSRGAGAVTPAAAWAGDSGFTPETMGGRPGTGEVTLTMPAGYGQRAQPKYAANYLSN